MFSWQFLKIKIFKLNWVAFSRMVQSRTRPLYQPVLVYYRYISVGKFQKICFVCHLETVFPLHSLSIIIYKIHKVKCLYSNQLIYYHYCNVISLLQLNSSDSCVTTTFLKKIITSLKISRQRCSMQAADGCGFIL